MKQKDIITLALVVIISGVVSLILTNIIFGSPKNNNVKVEVVEAISSEFKLPDARYFNDESIDPTQIIRIGDNNNQQPFNKQR